MKWAVIYRLALLITVISITVSCASIEKSYHERIVKGTIVDVNGPEVYVRVGTKDGARTGQQFDVYRIAEESPIEYSGTRGTENPLPQTPPPAKEYTGKIRITRVLNEHFSDAIVLSGTVVPDELVESSSNENFH